MDFDNPKTFNEKLQWLKLYNRKPKYTTMVDKVAVKDYVASIIGPEYIIPTLGVWDSPNDIEWDKLPNQFVLKTNHDGGCNGVVVCKDKATLNKRVALRELKRSFNRNSYLISREWPYKNVPHKILAEQYLEDKQGALIDYKFSCFGGNADNVMVCADRHLGDTKFYFFDRQWNLLRLNKRGIEAPKDFTLPKPEGMDKMFELAETLSKDLPYARVDFYNVDGHIYFGEITFFPAGGTDSNLLPETDLLFGSKIKLPKK
ncbi:MAG: glycosyl transferase [Paludibacteraceae bacterium]|nr:glycosyl transferase [Paludibacteraceae bacterium]